MKRRVILLLCLAVCVGRPAAVNLHAEEPAAVPAASLPAGEHLVYTISWLWIPVGIGEVWVKEKIMRGGREVIPVVGVIRTNQVLSRVFPMQDEAVSWIDVETLQSVRFEKKIREMRLKTEERMIFDSGTGKGFFERLETGESAEFEIPVPVHDVFSAFYWARRQVLTPGESVKTLLVVDQKIWELEAHARSRETLKVHGTEIETLRIEPVTRVEGKERRGRAWFYLTEDASHMPVRIVYKAPFGSVVGTLQDFEEAGTPELPAGGAGSPENRSRNPAPAEPALKFKSLF